MDRLLDLCALPYVGGASLWMAKAGELMEPVLGKKNATDVTVRALSLDDENTVDDLVALIGEQRS